MGSLAITLCHLAAGRVDGVVSLKAARSVDIAAAQLLVREQGLAIDLPDAPPFGGGAARPRRPLARRRGGQRGAVRAGWRDALDPARASSCATLAHDGWRRHASEILAALGRVIDPELRKPVTELDMVRDVEIDGGDVTVTIALTVVGCPLRSSFEDQVAGARRRRCRASRSVTLEFDVMSPDERAALTTKLRGGAEVRGVQLPATTRVLAVASGKGGVGKSTLTVNIAAALAARGHEVGILDADIYGHSIPHMLGIDQKPVVVDKMIVPPVAHDLKLMSIGFFLDDNQPVMWRGPMLHRAFEQFLQDVHWGELDVLVVDMPPGTGRRLDLARPAAAARGDRRRHDAAAARPGGRLARRDDGAEDRTPRRRRASRT